jgi:hypothetical protein
LSLPRRLTLSPHGCKRREYGLERNEDKTRLIRFGRFAAFSRAKRGEGKPEAFPFLGLQHLCGKNRLGRFEVRRITDGKRRRKKSVDPVPLSAPGGAPLVQNPVPSQSTTTYLEEAGSDLRPLAAHSSCSACLSGRSLRRQTPYGVTSKVRTVCSSSCKYGSVRGVAGNGHPYRDGCPGPGLQTPQID